ncbi:MAG: ATP-binding protein [Myxococcales bacterium]|nr:ATP-binding protein [Myxococcales bacterium]
MYEAAIREALPGRIALCGPPGSGKTFTALTFARALIGPAGRIAVIDTEQGSAAKYAGLEGIGAFEACVLGQFHPAHFVQAIEEAEAAGHDALVIDSLSHAWMGRGGVLDLVDAARAMDGKGLSRRDAWRLGSRHHERLLDAIRDFSGHVIVTLRAKVEYVLEESRTGRKFPRCVGKAPIQREGIEYEFDLVARLDNARLFVTKSRAPTLHARVVDRPDALLMREYSDWLCGHLPDTSAGGSPADDSTEALVASLRRVKLKDDLRHWCHKHGRELPLRDESSKKALRRAFADACARVDVRTAVASKWLELSPSRAA